MYFTEMENQNRKEEKKLLFLKKKNLLQLGVRSALILVDATDKGYVRMSSLVVLWARSIKKPKNRTA